MYACMYVCMYAATCQGRRRDLSATTPRLLKTRQKLGRRLGDVAATSWRPHGDVAATSKHICRGDVVETSPWCEC